jgi:hypothetical protein
MTTELTKYCCVSVAFYKTMTPPAFKNDRCFFFVVTNLIITQPWLSEWEKEEMKNLSEQVAIMSNCCGFLSYKKGWCLDQVFQICEISSVLPNKTEKDHVRLLELKFEQKKDDLWTLYIGYCSTECRMCSQIGSHINKKLAVIGNNEFRTHVLTLP